MAAAPVQGSKVVAVAGVSTLPPGRETFEVQVSVWGLVALRPRQREEGLGAGGIINFDVYICK